MTREMPRGAKRVSALTLRAGIDRSSRNAGFSLVELSVVIAIIAVLTSGVITGNSLLQRAKIAKFLDELSIYVSGYTSFAGVYNGAPGDITNAQSLFGSTYKGMSITNGGGGGCIAWTEGPQLWIQLSAAGFITGTTFTSASSTINSPWLVPTSASLGNMSMSRPMLGVGYVTNFGNACYQVATANNAFVIGITSGGTGGPSQSGVNSVGAFLVPSDMSYIDTKIDDGAPRSGNVWGMGSTATGTSACASSLGTTGSITDGTYTTANSSKNCWMLYDLD